MEVPPSPASADDRLARLAPVLAGLATFALHAACWGRYGIFRDELYFIACGQRLAAGYVDQPPGIAIVARLASALFGTRVPGLRLLSWLAAATTVYLAGRLAARLGGGGAGAALAAIATFACLLLHGTAHLLTMNAFDPLLILALVHVLLTIARGGDPRLWVAAGGLAGIAVLFKYTSAVLALGLLAGLVIDARRTLWTRWALVGAGVGLAAVLPNFVWQAAHGFPFLELARNGLLYKNAPISPLGFLGGVLFEANPGDAPLWLGGLAWLCLARAARPARFAGIGALLYLGELIFGHGKVYYAAPVLPVLLAAGGAACAALVGQRRVWRPYAAALVASALVFAPMAIPILPVDTFVRYMTKLGLRTQPMERLRPGLLPQVYADQFGWAEEAAAVARVYASLPPEERDRAVVFGSDYGIASAVNVLGPTVGLPPWIGISGHNQYWLWGVPAGRGDPVIVVSNANETCGGLFRERLLGERLPTNPYVMPYEDAHWIWICRGAKTSSTAMPERVRHYE